MDWAEAVDGYCERLGPGLWAEPWNAVTNLAFVLVGLWMWRRSAGIGPARVLSAVLVVIGIGSGLFHTFAQTWAGVADVAPILVFVLLYVWYANRHYWRLGPVWSGVGTRADWGVVALTKKLAWFGGFGLVVIPLGY